MVIGRPCIGCSSYETGLRKTIQPGGIMPKPKALVLRLLAAGTGLCLSAGFLVAQVSVAETVSFPTEDDGTVFATLRGSGDHGVILAHGGQFTKESWEPQARVLADSGFATLAIDFRGRGASRGGPGRETDLDYAHLDVLGAVHYLRTRGAHRISIVGASFGGWAAARAATKLPPASIDRLILLAHSPINEPEGMQGRKLFITTKDDARGDGLPRLPSIRDQYERAPEPKELVILDGAAHAQHVFATAQGERLLAEIVPVPRARRGLTGSTALPGLLALEASVRRGGR